jgi:hypothetical protein
MVRSLGPDPDEFTPADRSACSRPSLARLDRLWLVCMIRHVVSWLFTDICLDAVAARPHGVGYQLASRIGLERPRLSGRKVRWRQGCPRVTLTSPEHSQESLRAN